MKRFKKILVVDDSNLLRDLAIDLLNETQAAEEVQQARHGKEALEILIKEAASGAHLADLIILDLQMPVMDGLEFLEALHESTQLNYLLNRVVVVTSVLTPKIADCVKAKGVQWYFDKPFSEQILQSLLREVG